MKTIEKALKIIRKGKLVESDLLEQIAEIKSEIELISTQSDKLVDIIAELADSRIHVDSLNEAHNELYSHYERKKEILTDFLITELVRLHETL